MQVMHLIAIVTFGSCLVAAAKEQTNTTAEFVATREWQIVGEGQAVPRGLHVRINLQTGLKEAKLLDESDQSEPDSKNENDNEPLALDYKPDIIEEALRKAKEQRTYAELRKNYKEFQKNFRTDGEVIVQLLREYRNYSKTPLQSELKAKLDTLENLEYLVHQIDNALLFIDNGGLNNVLLPIVVNETNTALRVSAMRVLGALSGNNPKAQIKIFDRNFGSHLAQTLSTASGAELSAALYAFGTLLRKFPQAQHSILSTYGTQALIGLLRSVDVELRIKGKAVTLISDLVLEQRMAFANQVIDSTILAQYNLLDINSWLTQHGYCEAMNLVLTTDVAYLLEQPEVVDQFTVALSSTEHLCQPLWSISSQLRNALLTIRHRFAQSKDEYRLEVGRSLSEFCAYLFTDTLKHTEL